MSLTDFYAIGTWDWSYAAAPRGVGCVLVARQTGRGTAWVIAPPAVSVRLDESDELRKQWRAARFDAVDPEQLVIAVGQHVAGSYHDLTMTDVRAIVPVEFQGWITRVRERQRTLADGFGRQDPRLAPNEEHVRAAWTRLAELGAPTQFRRHANEQLPDAIVEIPDTVEELLKRARGERPAPAQISSATGLAASDGSPTRPDPVFERAERLRERGRNGAARSAHQRLYELRLHSRGPNHPDTLQSRFMLGELARSDGDAAGARQHLQGVLRARGRSLGIDHPDTLTVRFALAEVCLLEGNLTQATLAHQRVLQARARVLGSEHRDTLRSRSAVAKLTARDDTAQALRRHQDVLDIQRRVLGSDDHDTLRTTNHVATIQMELGHWHDARRLLEPLFKHCKATLPLTHPLRAISTLNLTRCTVHLDPAETPNAICEPVGDLLWLLGTDPAAIPADIRQIQTWLKQSITSTAHTLLLTHTQRLALINATKFPAPKRTRSVRHDDGGLADWLGLTPGP